MSVNIQTGNTVKIQSGNRVLISAPGPQGPAGGGGTPGGSDTQVQFNDGGEFGGDAALTFNKTTGVLSATHIHGALAGNLYVHVKNTSGSTLAKGTPVYATGSVGVSGTIEVAAADYTNAAKMPAIGIIDTELIANAEGNAVVVGEITGLATNSYSINQELFTGTGGLLGSLPTSGQAQSIAVVSRVHVSTGIIVVNAQARLNVALTTLANNDGSGLTGITAAQVGAVADGDSPTFAQVTLSSGAISSGAGTLDYTHVGTQGDAPYLRVNLNDGTTDIGHTLIGFRGDGAGGGASFVQAFTTDFRIEQNGGSLADVYGGNFIGSGASLTSINASNVSSGTLPVANGGTGLTSPGTSGNVLTSNGTTWTSAAPSTGANPAGSGSELQFRSDATTFGAITNSSVSGGTITLGNAEALGTTTAPYLTLRNTTAAAAAGAQQVSPSFVLEGRGWKTTATAASQTVRFRQNVLPVEGSTNPSATWRLQNEINNSGTWNDTISVESGGSLRVVAGSTATQSLRGPTVGLYDSGASAMGFCVGANLMMYYNATSLILNGTGLSFSINADTILARDAAGVFAQRNGATNQVYRLYEVDSGANDEYLEISAASGTNVIRPQATGTGTASVVRYHTTTAVFWTSGSGSPESVVTAPVGSIYTRTDGGAATTLYVKESGTGSTGWVAK